MLCEALCIVGRLARLSDPAAASAAFRRAGRVAAEFGLRPWRVEAELGLGTAEALDQEFSAKLVSARDLALDGGLLLQASGAEVILGEQAYVTNGLMAWKSRHSECSILEQSSTRHIYLDSAICYWHRATQCPVVKGR